MLFQKIFFPYFSRTRTHGICGYMDATLLREERRNSVRMTCHYPGNEVDLGFLLDEANFQLKRHNLDLRSDTSSVWNFCACSLDVISRGNQRWCSEISAIFSGYLTIGLEIEADLKNISANI